MLDPELGRVAVGLHKAALLRLWLLGRRLSSAAGGAGWCQTTTLWSAVGNVRGWQITRRHFRRLLTKGDGLFWTRHNDRLYLTGIAKLAQELCVLAGLRGRGELIETNSPGMLKSVWVPLDGSHEQFEAHIYLSWLSAKHSKTFSRELLEKLWGRTANTLRQWESAHLSETLTVIPSFALVQDNETPIHYGADYHPAMHSRVFQLPNTYAARARQHPHSGQRRKVQHTVTGPFMAQGADTRKLYFESVKDCSRAIQRHSGDYMRFAFVSRRKGSNYFLTSADIY